MEESQNDTRKEGIIQKCVACTSGTLSPSSTTAPVSSCLAGQTSLVVSALRGAFSKLLLTCIVDEAVNHGYVGVIALVCQLSLSSISPHFHIGVEDCGLVSCTAEIIGGDGD